MIGNIYYVWCLWVSIFCERLLTNLHSTALLAVSLPACHSAMWTLLLRYKLNASCGNCIVAMASFFNHSVLKLSVYDAAVIHSCSSMPCSRRDSFDMLFVFPKVSQTEAAECPEGRSGRYVLLLCIYCITLILQDIVYSPGNKGTLLKGSLGWEWSLGSVMFQRLWNTSIR